MSTMARYLVDRLASHFAQRQEGAFGRWQLLGAGATAASVDRRLASGAFLTFTPPGVYGLPGHPGTWRRQLWIAHLAHTGSAIAGHAAAALHGFEGFNPGPIELIVPPEASARSAIAQLHRCEGALTTKIGGLPVTTIAQTAADLCSTIWATRLDRALDAAILAGRLTVAQLEERVRAYEGTRRRGLPLLRALTLERGDQAWVPTESELEVHLHRLVRRLGSRPKVLWQPALPWRPTTGERLDALLPDVGVLLEGDGRAWHARLRDFDADRWRDNEAIAHGLVPLRFTWAHLTGRLVACVDLTEATIATRRRRAA
jgi:hypothetical protein